MITVVCKADKGKYQTDTGWLFLWETINFSVNIVFFNLFHTLVFYTIVKDK